jgi:amino acid transporter
MNPIVLFMIAILVIIILVLIVTVRYMKKKREAGIQEDPNYQAFFYIGMSWLPIGIVFMVILNTGLGIAFLGLGAAYITIGLANKDKWKKKEK